MTVGRLDGSVHSRHLMSGLPSHYWADRGRYSHQGRSNLSSVKSRSGSTVGPIAERLAILLDVFSPWERISLTYRQFAAEIGEPVTEAAVEKWPQRKKVPADAARLIVTKARDRGLMGVTLEWVLWGEGERPQKTPQTTPKRPTGQRYPLAEGGEVEEQVRPRAPQEPQGGF